MILIYIRVYPQNFQKCGWGWLTQSLSHIPMIACFANQSTHWFAIRGILFQVRFLMEHARWRLFWMIFSIFQNFMIPLTWFITTSASSSISTDSHLFTIASLTLSYTPLVSSMSIESDLSEPWYQPTTSPSCFWAMTPTRPRPVVLLQASSQFIFTVPVLSLVHFWPPSLPCARLVTWYRFQLCSMPCLCCSMLVS